MQLSKDLRIGNWILKKSGERFEPLRVNTMELAAIEKAEGENTLDCYYKPIELNESVLF